jgi:hypothetical protein
VLSLFLNTAVRIYLRASIFDTEQTDGNALVVQSSLMRELIKQLQIFLIIKLFHILCLR